MDSNSPVVLVSAYRPRSYAKPLQVAESATRDHADQTNAQYNEYTVHFTR